MNRTQEQIAAFHHNIKGGLAGIYALSTPARERRHQNRRMNVGYQEEKPQKQPAIKLPTIERLDQIEAKANYIFNKLKEIQSEKAKRITERPDYK